MTENLIKNDKAEYRRIKSLSKFDLDYNELQEEFSSLVELAAMIAGTQMSVINLIDNYFQWSVSSKSIKLLQMPREDSVCDKTIRSYEPMEVKALDKDERFIKQKFSEGEFGFNYYLGIPLTLASGDNIGALCVLDRKARELSEKNKAMLTLVAKEIVNKLELKRKLDDSIFAMNEAVKVKNQVAHDVRGPINGITGLAEIVEGDDSSKEEMIQYFKLIKDSGKSLIELTNDILKKDLSRDIVEMPLINLKQLKTKLLKLYRLAAKTKNIDFQININSTISEYEFPKRKLLSIFGNLISNSIKFTAASGTINIELDILSLEKGKFVEFIIKDTGVGISKNALAEFRKNNFNSSMGTAGEKGFGLGLNLVKEMVQNLSGEMDITSEEGKGTEITVKVLVK